MGADGESQEIARQRGKRAWRMRLCSYVGSLQMKISVYPGLRLYAFLTRGEKGKQKYGMLQQEPKELK